MSVVRKRESAMTNAEKGRYINTIKKLIENGTYGKFVKFHSEMSHRMHSMGGMDTVGRNRFLSWHRVYLLKLEEEMRKVEPLCFIPYWRWTTQRRIPPWLSNFKPTVNVPGQGSITVTRDPGFPPAIPTNSYINSILSESTFNQFTMQLEVAHGNVHMWVGGTMADIMISPADPIFWLHHGNIDRIWSVWQKKPANQGKNPSLSGSARIMDPWTESVGDILKIEDLDYSYG
ncbi:MAG: tyrosinase family protein [Thaumarchaeota archaeon]|nr:MAG: tyrosinase family protein [Nitrososphaerota archaeon]